MDDAAGLGACEQIADERGVADVALDQLELVGMFGGRADLGDVGAFDGRVVEGIEVVEGDDALVAGEEGVCDVGADETGRAGEEDGGAGMSGWSGSGGGHAECD